MSKYLQTKKENFLYHLSYDIISKTNDDNQKTQEHIDLKKDLVWEILITCSKGIIDSYVSSTIIFESSQDINYWDNILTHFNNRIHYVLTIVKSYYTNDTNNYFQIRVNEVPNLNLNFQRDIVNFETDSFERVGRNRIPVSRVRV